jgi:predicted Rdx family selenoprotein
LAADLESQLSESSQLVQSSGGVFEVEHDGMLIFSKKDLGRFPAEGEVLSIVKALQSGMPLAQAKAQAAENVPQPPSFFTWLKSFMARKARVD